MIRSLRADSLALRLVAGAGLWIAAALLAGGFLLSASFRGYVERSFDDRLIALLESLVVVSELDPDGRVQLIRPVGEPRFDQVYSGWYWQISSAGAAPLRSRSLWDQTLPTAEIASGDEPVGFAANGPEDAEIRVIERDITLPGSARHFHYAVAADRSDIEAEIDAFNATLGWSLGVLGLGLLAAVFIQVRYGLGPLRRIRSALVAVRSGKASRLEGDFPVEIRPLSDELNVLLAHNAAVVERARTHVSNLAHGLKTPLSVLTNEAATSSGPLAETVQRQAVAMRHQIDHYLSRARAAATGAVLGARTEVPVVIEDLRRTLARIHADRAVEVEVEAEAGPALCFRGEREDLEEMLGNLMDNACKWARGRVRVSAAHDGDRLRFEVEDDGPGLDEQQRAALFQRGKRLDESVPGTGLGLAIVRDLAELYAGSIALGRSELGGLRATLVLPAADSAGAG